MSNDHGFPSMVMLQSYKNSKLIFKMIKYIILQMIKQHNEIDTWITNVWKIPV